MVACRCPDTFVLLCPVWCTGLILLGCTHDTFVWLVMNYEVLCDETTTWFMFVLCITRFSMCCDGHVMGLVLFIGAIYPIYM